MDDVFDAINVLDEMITSQELSYGGQLYTYDDLCGKWNGICSSNAILNIYRENNNTIENISLSYPLHRGLADNHILTDQIGKVEMDESGRVQAASLVGLSYFLQSGDDVIDISNAWLDVTRDRLFEYDDARVEVEFRTSNTIRQELEQSIETLYTPFVTGFVVLATFTVVACLLLDPVRSKPWMAFSGMVAAFMGVGSTIGLMSAAGVKFASSVASLPFLMIGKTFLLSIKI